MTNQQDKNLVEVEGNLTDGKVGLCLMLIVILFTFFYLEQQPLQNTDEEKLDPYGGRQQNNETIKWNLPNDELLGFVLIPEGSFIMGSNPTFDRMAYANERWSLSARQGKPILNDFFINKYEVTNAQFALFMDHNPGSHVSQNTRDQKPVTNVSWPQALNYSKWLDNELRNSSTTPDQLTKFLNMGGRITLPNEAQWEKAARGTDGRIFPWGNQPSNLLANFDSQSANDVGSHACRECANGLSDMAGNVWEMTLSPLNAYPFVSERILDTEEAQPLLVMRGGGYNDAANNIRATVRGGVGPGSPSPVIGFRIAITK